MKGYYFSFLKFFVILCFLTSGLYAQDRFYMGGGFGLSWLGSSEEVYDDNTYSASNTDTYYDIGFSKFSKLGYKWKNYRLEVEKFVYENSVDNMEKSKVKVSNVDKSSQLSFSTFFLSLYYDFDNLENKINFVPFVGGGIGTSKIDIVREYTNSSLSQSGEDDSISFHVTYGIEKRFTKNLSLDVAFRLISYTNIDLKDNSSNTIEQKLGPNMTLMTGVKYAF